MASKKKERERYRKAAIVKEEKEFEVSKNLYNLGEIHRKWREKLL